jgi:hypothetical protein
VRGPSNSEGLVSLYDARKLHPFDVEETTKTLKEIAQP